MNKYQEALDSCCGGCSCEKSEAVKTLNELVKRVKTLNGLVKRATPIKPINIQERSDSMVVGQCPRCRYITTNLGGDGGRYDGFLFCKNCGQAIDWTDWSEEK